VRRAAGARGLGAFGALTVAYTVSGPDAAALAGVADAPSAAFGTALAARVAAVYVGVVATAGAAGAAADAAPSKTRLIVGAVIGAAILLALLACVWCLVRRFLCKWKRPERKGGALTRGPAADPTAAPLSSLANPINVVTATDAVAANAADAAARDAEDAPAGNNPAETERTGLTALA